MFENSADFIRCELCLGQLKLNNKETLSSYSIITNINSLNMSDHINKLLNKYLIYECTNCKAKFKYTYKDLEKGIRKNITKRFLAALLEDEITENFINDFKYYIYCGRCSGFDGTGSCTKDMFDNCKIKRFPINEL